MLNNKGRPLYTSDPRPPTEVEAGQSVHVDYNWRESYGGSALESGPQTVGRPTPHDQLPPSYPEDKLRAQQSPTFTEDSDTISRTLDHRDSVKEYLQGQFYLQQTYSEHIHWRRVRQIGHGGQAKCFCIEDCVNNYALCLKEEVENKKALDEAFICLTLARLVSDAPPNIVEFFGASILPHYSGSNRLQLFLELMPGCLQEYVFENGPLPPDTTLNYSFQLFEALDYLHQELRVIHCDIKPANLLIDYNCQRLKVADFGCAELLDEGCHRKGLPENKDAGTLWYNPPDFYCSGNCSFGMDIWQAGCSVLFMVTGRRPWRHLCMDVDKQKAGPGLAGLLKKRCCQIIGEQNERLHPLPAFLTSRVGEGGVAEGGAGVRQLLVGCLQPASSRLSAKDLAYLAAVSETTSQYQRSRIVRQLGYSPSHAVLDRLQRESHTHQSMVDIYLGKEMLRTDINSMPHAMLNGWLGSVPHRNGMTYSDLLNLARQHIPVSSLFTVSKYSLSLVTSPDLLMIAKG
ncbi:Mitogen-activated protein kinase kinase kinase 1 [Geodia barretti]|uniref:Mitogen-activated protein kinase kinase kinase 1 n=1 Tax=Geodia barretti TaxID=519541 RepID=A0AA35WEH6_GEOBA|nr:Mitogen-activated protein kinase kinase kinase 1 [Geodia barretti]